jgi:hypothetical protein
MTISVLSPMSFTSWYDPYTEAPIQANLYFYHAGTLDLISVYTDSELSITHAQPCLTGGSGRAPAIWIPFLSNPTNTYRVRVFDQYSVLLEDVDGLAGATDPTSSEGGPAPADPTRLLSTGDVIWSFANKQPRLGFVMCNGESVGSAGSAATQRQHADTQALFTWLWQQDAAGTILTVAPGGRGASAASDWAANKHIATPDLAGRSVVGVDAMATGARNRLAGVTFQVGNQAMLGSVAGAPLHTLDATQVPNHSHGFSDPGHQHYGVTPDHLHYNSVSTGGEGGHQHYLSIDSGTESHDHSHQYTAPYVNGQHYTLLSAGAAGVQGTLNTSGRNQAHYHNTTGWTLAGYGNHAHPAYHSPAGADRSLAFWVDVRGTGIVISPTTGGGAAHNNVQPSMTLLPYMRL